MSSIHLLQLGRTYDYILSFNTTFSLLQDWHLILVCYKVVRTYQVFVFLNFLAIFFLIFHPFFHFSFSSLSTLLHCFLSQFQKKMANQSTNGTTNLDPNSNPDITFTLMIMVKKTHFYTLKWCGFFTLEEGHDHCLIG